MHVHVYDFEIADLIASARWMLKNHRDACNNRPEHCVDPWPDGYEHYLKVRNMVRTLMKARREHRKNVAHVWKVYAESLVSKLQDKSEVK